MVIYQKCKNKKENNNKYRESIKALSEHRKLSRQFEIIKQCKNKINYY